MTQNHITKILLVEDENMLAEMYVTKFTSEGFAIVRAADGQQGVDMAVREKPDLILLDIILPKLDGFAVLKAVKEHPVTADIPVILLTNLGQDEDVEKGRKLGAADYMVKANHTPADVVEKIRAFLNQHHS
ncbi:MAG: response regulator [Candidatus Kerfeldbacteria bacterium]|nr:response regulator [Candidatus Kerfeldbacteria bacterium]